jgi:hypothetical protein
MIPAPTFPVAMSCKPVSRQARKHPDPAAMMTLDSLLAEIVRKADPDRAFHPAPNIPAGGFRPDRQPQGREKVLTLVKLFMASITPSL